MGKAACGSADVFMLTLRTPSVLKDDAKQVFRPAAGDTLSSSSSLGCFSRGVVSSFSSSYQDGGRGETFTSSSVHREKFLLID